MRRVAVLAAGAWGTTFGKVVADAGADVTLWTLTSELAAAIRETRENPEFLPGIHLPDRIAATADAAEAIDGAHFVVLAIPSQVLRDNLARWAPLAPPTAVYVSLMKGVELGTMKRMTEVVREIANVPPERVVAVSGPNLAKEIAREQPAATVVACESLETARALQEAISTPYFRPYTNTDVIGCELGGAVKNVIALAVGMAEGMGYGDNTKAALITRGLAEIARLGVTLGADPRTFSGLAGMGDLVATCTSPLSRNRTFGERLGRGVTLEEATAQSAGIAEGVKSCRPTLELARKHNVDMPITEHVVRTIHEGMSPEETVRSLMSRDMKRE